MSYPNLPGIPPLAALPAAGAVLVSGVLSNLLDSLRPVWGIFDATGKVKKLSPDSFLSIDYRNSASLPTHPVEQGGFSTFNKVKTPYSITVRVTKSRTLAASGTKDDRSAFLNTLDGMVQDTLLYTVVTPEKTYPNANLEDFDYKREVRGGAELIVAALHFTEVQYAVKTAATSGSSSDATGTSSPSAQAPVDGGMVQTSTAAGTYTGT